MIEIKSETCHFCKKTFERKIGYLIDDSKFNIFLCKNHAPTHLTVKVKDNIVQYFQFYLNNNENLEYELTVNYCNNTSILYCNQNSSLKKIFEFPNIIEGVSPENFLEKVKKYFIFL